ncbi:FCD domain-containing protein [Paraburkholderia sp. IW21]|uniref:FCD domain-containing protein n=1 Tax=Paraburkholderia sp. IW21 TaxID=3242488 RepID=UPI00351F85CA
METPTRIPTIGMLQSTLEESGLVRLTRNRGVFVRKISVVEADDIFAVRASLEELIGRTLARCITLAQLKSLNDLSDRMGEAVAAGQMARYTALNFEFHDQLALFTGNGKLLDIYRRLVKELTLFRHQTLAHQETLPVSLAEHQSIIDRIAAGDGDAAGRALVAHVTASCKRMHTTHPENPAHDNASLNPHLITQRETS